MIDADPRKLAAVRRLQEIALQRNKDVDYETMKLVPMMTFPKTWPESDRTPEDYEGGRDE